MKRFENHRPSAVRAFFGLLALAVLVGFGVGAALAASALPPGDNVFGRLSIDLNARTVRPGDGFRLYVVPPYPNADPTYAGAHLAGHVADVQRAGQGRQAKLRLAFDAIVLADGRTALLHGHVTQIQENRQNVTPRKASSAGVGMIVGNILGKWVGSNLGGTLGAAGGFLYASNDRANLDVPRDSVVRVQVDRPVPRSESRG